MSTSNLNYLPKAPKHHTLGGGLQHADWRGRFSAGPLGLKFQSLGGLASVLPLGRRLRVLIVEWGAGVSGSHSSGWSEGHVPSRTQGLSAGYTPPGC